MTDSQGSWTAGIYPDGTAFVVLKNKDAHGKQIEIRNKGMAGGMGLTLWKNPDVSVSMGNIPFDSVFDMLVDFVKAKGDVADAKAMSNLCVFMEAE